MFVSPFTVSISCDVAIVVIYLQRAGEFGGSPWFAIIEGHVFTTEMVDVVSESKRVSLSCKAKVKTTTISYVVCKAATFFLLTEAIIVNAIQQQ